MSCNIHALNIGRFVFCETGPEHQRRSIVQPRVVPAGRDYPGSDAPVSSTLKGLHLPCPSAQAHPRKTNRHGLRREARKLSGRDAFARTKVIHHSKTPCPPESGAKATALHTLARFHRSLNAREEFWRVWRVHRFSLDRPIRLHAALLTCQNSKPFWRFLHDAFGLNPAEFSSIT